MIKVTNRYFEMLLDPGRAEVLQRLSERRWPVRTAYWLHRALKEIQVRAADYLAAKTDLLRGHAELSEPDAAGRVTVQRWTTSQQTYLGELKDLLAIEVVLQSEPVPLLDAGGELSLAEMEVLEPIIAIPDSERRE